MGIRNSRRLQRALCALTLTLALQLSFAGWADSAHAELLTNSQAAATTQAQEAPICGLAGSGFYQGSRATYLISIGTQIVAGHAFFDTALEAIRRYRSLDACAQGPQGYCQLGGRVLFDGIMVDHSVMIDNVAVFGSAFEDTALDALRTIRAEGLCKDR